MSKQLLATFCLAAAVATTPAHLQAQQKGERSFTVQAGGFTYDYGSDATSPLAGLRVDWRLARHLRAELGGSWSRARTDLVQDFVSGSGGADLMSREVNTNLGSLSVGLIAEAHLGRFSPYIGAATGVFVRLDPEGGDRFIHPMQAFPAGLRVAVTDRLSLGGELRLRFDQHQGGGTSIDTEQTLGLSVNF